MGFSLADLNPFKAITDVVGTVIDRVIPDKNAANQAKVELAKMQLNGELQALAAQTDINKIEAANPNIFVAGWRPWIGWVCGFGLFIQFIVNPLFTWLAALFGHPTKFPDLDMGTLAYLLAALLGLSTQRTVEKIQGAAGNH